MAKLTTATRKSLPSSTFALPGRRYPIPDRSHAANAESRVSQYGTPEEKAKVRAAVKRKFPSLPGVKGKMMEHKMQGGFKRASY